MDYTGSVDPPPARSFVTGEDVGPVVEHQPVDGDVPVKSGVDCQCKNQASILTAVVKPALPARKIVTKLAGFLLNGSRGANAHLVHLVEVDAASFVHG